jgi:hypothetical protein
MRELCSLKIIIVMKFEEKNYYSKVKYGNQVFSELYKLLEKI